MEEDWRPEFFALGLDPVLLRPLLLEEDFLEEFFFAEDFDGDFFDADFLAVDFFALLFLVEDFFAGDFFAPDFFAEDFLDDDFFAVAIVAQPPVPLEHELHYFCCIDFDEVSSFALPLSAVSIGGQGRRTDRQRRE